MKFKFAWNFALGICFQDVSYNAEPEAIKFDLELHWKAGQIRSASDSLISIESRFCRDVDDGGDPCFDLVGIPAFIRESHVRFGRGKRARRYAIRGSSSGGNMYWETVLLPRASAPHVLNFLRHHRAFAPDGGDCDFTGRIWECRRSLNVAILRGFVADYVIHWLRCQAKQQGISLRDYLQHAGVDL